MKIRPIDRITWPQSERRKCLDHTHVAESMERRKDWRIQPQPEPLWISALHVLSLALLVCGFTGLVLVSLGV
jgi:hypothetical protein